MPSPVGHSLAGLIIYSATNRSIASRGSQLRALFMLVANAPDLDFLPGLVVGDLSRYHHGPSHSIGFAVLMGVMASVVISRRLYAFVMGFSLYLSHVVLDYLIQDPSPPNGVQIVWPLSHEYYMAPFAFFPKFDYRPGFTESVLLAFFSLNNLMTVMTELLLLLPLLIFVPCGHESVSRFKTRRLRREYRGFSNVSERSEHSIFKYLHMCE